MAERIVADVEYRELDRLPGYRFGSDGSVWSKWAGKSHSKGTKRIRKVAAIGDTWKQRQPVVNTRSGYHQCQLRVCEGGVSKYKTFRIHRLILEAFIGPQPEGCEGCHNDGNKNNNAIDNLRWDTGTNNAGDRKRHGKYAQGTQLPWTKLTPENVLAIRDGLNAGESPDTLAKRFTVTTSAIHAIKQQRTWNHLSSQPAPNHQWPRDVTDQQLDELILSYCRAHDEFQPAACARLLLRLRREAERRIAARPDKPSPALPDDADAAHRRD